MIQPACSTPSSRPSLKQPTGWFAAGESFRQALNLLSDGAFKLFAYLCLEADRQSGRLAASQPQLARALGKSKRAIGHYVTELQVQGLCRVEAAKNQHAPTRFEICDAYWPYHRTSPRENQAGRDNEAPTEPPASQQPPDYVASIRERFLALGCSNGQFNAAQQALARQLQQQGVSLKRVEDAMLLAAYRKYVCWLNGKAPEPIASLRYFEPLIDELERQPVPEGYLNYLRSRLLAQKSNRQSCWRKQCASRFQTR
jgi:hypothetical protein